MGKPMEAYSGFSGNILSNKPFKHKKFYWTVTFDRQGKLYWTGYSRSLKEAEYKLQGYLVAPRLVHSGYILQFHGDNNLDCFGSMDNWIKLVYINVKGD